MKPDPVSCPAEETRAESSW